MSHLTTLDEKGFSQIFKAVGSTPFRARRRNRWFAECANNINAKRILEIGCGMGDAAAFVAELTSAEVVAVDISDIFLDQARTNHVRDNLSFEKFDLFKDDLSQLGKFDFIYGNGILHHLVLELGQFLIILKKILNSEGGVAFIEPNFLNPYCAFIFGTQFGRRFAKLEPDEMAFTRGELLNYFTSSKWRDVSIDTRDFLIPGVPEALIKPITFFEPAFEATVATRWLAQSHFLTARV